MLHHLGRLSLNALTANDVVGDLGAKDQLHNRVAHHLLPLHPLRVDYQPHILAHISVNACCRRHTVQVLKHSAAVPEARPAVTGLLRCAPDNARVGAKTARRQVYGRVGKYPNDARSNLSQPDDPLLVTQVLHPSNDARVRGRPILADASFCVCDSSMLMKHACAAAAGQIGG